MKFMKNLTHISKPRTREHEKKFLPIERKLLVIVYATMAFNLSVFKSLMTRKEPNP